MLAMDYQWNSEEQGGIFTHSSSYSSHTTSPINYELVQNLQSNSILTELQPWSFCMFPGREVGEVYRQQAVQHSLLSRPKRKGVASAL
jgi:hypothetical protein